MLTIMYRIARRPAVVVPRRSLMGSHHAQQNALRPSDQPRTIQRQGARPLDDYGYGGWWICVRSECRSIHFPEIEGKESLTAVLDVC